MLDSTIVYCAGEFGRTPKINKNAGRDHWARSMAVVLAGGGFKRRLRARHDRRQRHGPARPSRARRTTCRRRCSHCLGIDPHTELMTGSGRPIQLFREGKVIKKLLA